MSPDGFTTWAYFTDYHGIPGEELLSIAVDGDTVWVGTDDGGWYWNTRGDPFQWTGGFSTFSLRDNTILTILPDGDRIWFGTEGGMCQALKQSPGDTSTQSWYTTAQGLPSDEVRCAVYTDTVLWAGTANGVARLEDTLWVGQNQGLPSRDVRSLAAMDTILWVGTAGGVARWDGLQWDALSEGLLSTDIHSVDLDPTGVVWAGTHWKGIAKFLADSLLWHHYMSEGPAGNDFSSVALDVDGSLWCAHFFDSRTNRIVSRFHNGEWETYNEGNEWHTGGIRWVAVDSKGNKWFGAWASGEWGGVVKLESDNQTFYRYETPVSPIVGAVAVDADDNIWISAYSEAVAKFSPTDSTWEVHQNDYTTGVQHISFDSKGNVWFASTYGVVGVTVLTSDRSWQRIERLPSTAVGPLAVDARDDVWAGTIGGGLCRIRDFEVMQVFTEQNTGGQLLGNVTSDIDVDWSGGVWLMVELKGLNRLNPDGSWGKYLPADGLASNRFSPKVDGLAFDTETGVLWIGTRYGLSRFETGIYPKSAEVDSIEVYPNPFIPSEPDHERVVFYRVPEGAVVRIYTLSGELVREIAGVDPATHQAFWDGRNAAGEQVGSGVYIFSVTTGDRGRGVGKVAVIR